ncbi:hypothetical protein Trichorick_01395 (plasmid) [Candidatus Trichorickettsia mobilis]|uniref:Uncharacterized protein n=1 Tax=Candidatus Trichorickettsia mobilis TaxID=1346319 RepID=A0ABZ0UWJ9_9RICK|nr:hypothetical protein [Candidatus Trichorickettsia mobilis]WPY01482.1 hypothetical protein Trichorick_01395 [Candidatus Trichorickettsia mobilis]
MSKYTVALSKLVNLDEDGVKFELCDYDLAKKYYVRRIEYSTEYKIVNQIFNVLVHCQSNPSKAFKKFNIRYLVKNEALIPINIEDINYCGDIKLEKVSFWKKIIGE